MHTKPTVDWIITDGQVAVASWHAEHRQGIVNLRLRSGRWWWRAAAVKNNVQLGGALDTYEGAWY